MTKQWSLREVFAERFAELETALETLLRSSVYELHGNEVGKIPTDGGIYRVMLRDAGLRKSVYVGQAKNLHQRLVRNHLTGSLERSTLLRKLVKSGQAKDLASAKEFLREQCVIQYLVEAEERRRTRCEHFAIAVLSPELND